MPGLPGIASLLPAGKAALRLAAGTASLAAGGFVLSALRETPAALGASPAAINAVAAGSPNCRDGVFCNLEPMTALNLDAEENRLVIFDVITGTSESRPKSVIPLADPPPIT